MRIGACSTDCALELGSELVVELAHWNLHWSLELALELEIGAWGLRWPFALERRTRAWTWACLLQSSAAIFNSRAYGSAGTLALHQTLELILGLGLDLALGSSWTYLLWMMSTIQLVEGVTLSAADSRRDLHMLLGVLGRSFGAFRQGGLIQI